MYPFIPKVGNLLSRLIRASSTLSPGGHVPLLRLGARIIKLPQLPSVRILCSSASYPKIESDGFYDILGNKDSYKCIKNSTNNVGETRISIESILSNYMVAPQENSSPEEILRYIDELSNVPTTYQHFLFDEKYEIFIRALCDAIPKLGKDEFTKIVEKLNKFEIPPMAYLSARVSIALSLSHALEKHEFNKDELLAISNLFYRLSYYKTYGTLINKLGKYLDDFSKEDIVTFMFFASLGRTADVQVLDKIVDKIKRNIDIYDIDELAVISLGFFKTKYKVESKTIINRIAEYIKTESTTMKEITLSSFLKTLIYSSVFISTQNHKDHRYKEEVADGLLKLLPRINSFSSSTCSRILRMGLETRKISTEVLDAIASKAAQEDLLSWRIKDLSWFLRQFGTFQVKLSEKEIFYGRLLESFKHYSRTKELEKFPGMLAGALVGACYVGVFNYELLARVLHPSYINGMTETQAKYAATDLFLLDKTVEIECPDYTGPRIKSHHLFDELQEKNKLPHEKEVLRRRDKDILSVVHHLDKIFRGELCAEIIYTVPHLNHADIGLQVNKRKIVPVEKWEKPDGSPRGHQKIILLYHSSNAYHIHLAPHGYSRRLLGINIMRRRQLENLGYTVIEIPYFEFNQCKNRLVYLTKCLSPYVDI